MPTDRILILGGAGLAREAANALVGRGANVITSLAGVTRKPHLPLGEIHMGGFGGSEGLALYLQQNRIDVLVDATHPFAAQMSAHAQLASAKAGVKIVRLEAPIWQPQKGDDWRTVNSVSEAARALPLHAKVAVTVGRKEIAAFFTRADLSGIARMIEPPDMDAPPHWQVLLERPPFTLETEVDLLRSSEAEFLICKNAGGVRVAKLDAASVLGLPVIMVSRPFKPSVVTVENVAELLGSLGFAD